MSRTLILRNHSENFTAGGGFSIFASEIWLTPSKDWQNLGASHRWLAKYAYPPLHIHFLITHLYVFYGLIWTISVILIIGIWHNLGLSKSGCHPLTNSEIFAPPSKASTPSNIFWTIPWNSEQTSSQSCISHTFAIMLLVVGGGGAIFQNLFYGAGRPCASFNCSFRY